MTETRSQTDKRIDDLRSDTRAGFERVDKRIDDVVLEMRSGFERADKRMDDVVLEMRAGFERADKRIDDLRVDAGLGFARVDKGFARVDADLRELRVAIGSFQRPMIGFFATTIGSIVAGVIVLVLSHS